MSHETFVYPQSTGGLIPGHASSVQVREEEGEYVPFSTVLLRYTDLLDQKLPQIRALGWLLEGAEDIQQTTARQTGLLIVDLVDEVMDAHRKMWAEYQRHRREE